MPLVVDVGGDQVHHRFVRGHDVLVGRAVGLAEQGAQPLVPGDHVVQGGPQCRNVERPREAHDEGHVVRGARAFEPVEEPQTALAEGERHPLGTFHGLQGAPGLTRLVRPAGEPGDGRRLEQRPDGHLHPHRGPDAADQPGGEQRVPAQLEEVVVDPDPVHVQHVGEEDREELLARVARSPALRGTGQRGRGQGLAVEFAVRGERQPVERDEGGGDHVGRQHVHDVLADPGGVAADHVRGEPRIARLVLTHDHGGLRDVRRVEDRGLDLAQLDPEAADLHLVVGPAEVGQRAVRGPAGQVSGAVHAGPGRAVRVGDEALCAEAGPAEVAAGQAGPGDVQLAGGARRDGLQALVEDVHVQVGDADADDAVGGGGRRDAVERVVGDVHRGLGDAVHVDQHGRVVGVPVVPGRQPPQVERFTAEDHVPERQLRAGVLLVGLHELVEGGRGLVEHGDALVREQPQEVERRPAHVLRNHDQRAAAQQRPPQLPDGEVERVGVEQRPDVGRVEAEPLVRPREEPYDVLVGDQDALGPSRGARRVDDVRAVVRAQGRARRIGDGSVGQFLDDDVGAAVGQGHVRAEAGDDDGRASVLHDEGDALGRVVRIQRQVDATGLEDAEDAHHEVHAARQGERDHGLRAHALGDEGVGESVRPGVQLRVGQALRALGDGDRLGVRGGGGLEQRGDGRPLGRRSRCGPLRQQFPAFRRGQDCRLPQPLVRVGHDRPQQPGEPVDDVLHGGPVEQIGGVLDQARQPGGLAVGAVVLLHVEVEVELGDPGTDVLQTGPQTGQAQVRLGVVLEQDHDLEQRVVREGAGRVEHLDQALERHLLVRVRGQVRLADPGEEFPEGRVPGCVGAQHQGVDEEADQFVERLVGPSGDDSAERDVVAGSEPGEQSGHRRLEHHEEGGVRVAGEFEQPGVQVGVELEVHLVAAEARGGGPRPVRGQLQLLGEPGEVLLPVGELPRQQALRVALGTEQFTLPERVVGVLDGQRGPGRRLPLGPRRVRDGDVPRERCVRPAVTGDVMQQEQEDVLGLRKPEQGHAQRQFGGEIETVAGGDGELLGEPGRVGLDQGDLRLLGVGDQLVGLPVHLRKAGAQALVPRHHVAEGGFECRLVEGSRHAQQQRHGVGGAAAFEPVQEPQAPLRRRDGDVLRPCHRAEGEPRLLGARHPFGEFGDGGGLEEVPDGEFHVEHRTDAAEQPDRGERMPAEVEEAVVDADGRHSEHGGEETAEDLLLRGARRTEGEGHGDAALVVRTAGPRRGRCGARSGRGHGRPRPDEFSDGHGGVVHESGEQADEVGRERVDLRTVQQVRPVLQAQLKPRPGKHRERQRVVGGVVVLQHARAEAGCGFPYVVVVVRVVLDDGQRVEQVAQSTEPLYVVESEILVRDQPGLLVLYALQHPLQGLRRVEPDADGQRVDEHADHRLAAGQLREASGVRGAEHHVLLSGAGAEQQAPQALDGGVEGDPVLAQPLLEPPGHRVGQVAVDLERTGGFLRARLGEEGRCGKPVERAPPGVVRRRTVLPGYPGQVVAERGRLRQGLAPVEREQLVQHQLHGPAVEEDVVVDEDEPVLVLGEPDQGEAQQRRPPQVKALGTRLGHDPGEGGFALGLGESREVDLPPRQFEAVDDHLYGPGQPLVVEARP